MSLSSVKKVYIYLYTHINIHIDVHILSLFSCFFLPGVLVLEENNQYHLMGQMLRLLSRQPIRGESLEEEVL